MYVKFQANWFGPDGVRYRMNREGDRLTYVPDEFASQLPSTARIVKPGGEGKFSKNDEGFTLRDFDMDRIQADAHADMAEKAEKHRQEQQAEGAKRQKQLEQAAKMRAAKQAKKEVQ